MKPKKFMSLDLVFYTCFYGSNKNIACQIPAIPSAKYKCYYFTNNKTVFESLKNTQWTGIFDDITTTDDAVESAMIAKKIKAIPHMYGVLQGHDYLCYLDSKLELVNELFVEKMIQTYFITQHYALLMRHHWFIGGNVWHEYEESMKQPRYVSEKEKYTAYIARQLELGLSETTPTHCATGFLIRNMKHEKMIELNNTWYDHILACGIQDQISFFFVKQLFPKCVHAFTEIPFIRRRAPPIVRRPPVHSQ